MLSGLGGIYMRVKERSGEWEEREGGTDLP